MEEKNTGVIEAVCTSEKKGTAKTPKEQIVLIENFGVEGDAHAGPWHRQVSLLSVEKVREFNAKGGGVKDGDFGENLLVSGFDLKTVPVGTIFTCGEVVLQITQIGKKCHSQCQIFHRVGDCIMPREGIFARVLKGGVIKPKDKIVMHEKKYAASVLVASDRCSRGEREDLSGPCVKSLIEKDGYTCVECTVVPDDEDTIYKKLVEMADVSRVDVIFTSGGTGLSPRDCTPEATLRAATKNVPGIAEAIRANSLKFTDRAMLSRAVCVMRGSCLIVNLPGSVKACQECLDFLLPTLKHGIQIMKGDTGDCGRS